jgi:lipopolysaccharide transport system ATP-binding protein
MSAAIRVDGLSKRYQLSAPELAASSFRDLLAQLAATPLRRLRHLGGGGPSFWALQDVSFAVQPGEVVAVIGRNGAGKSTLLKVLSRITEPTAGRIELRGRIGSLLEVGTGFHPDLTGRENVFLNGAILGMSRGEIRRKFDAIVEFAEIARFIDTPVKHYSSGMYLRLAFSVAAHLDGEILLVDEVLAVGDAAFQRKCLDKVRDLTQQARTVLFVSHNMTAVSSLCTRALVIQDGRLTFDGPVDAGVRQYLSQHLDEGDVRWDLDGLARARPDLGRAARLTSVTALPAAPEGFAFREPMRFRVAFSSTVPLADLTCAVNLDDSTGRRIVSFESSGFERGGAEADGAYELEVAASPFGLRPGRYLLSASVFSGGRYYDYLIHFGIVTVLPFEHEGTRCLEEFSDRGPIDVPSTWRVLAGAPVSPVHL